MWPCLSITASRTTLGSSTSLTTGTLSWPASSGLCILIGSICHRGNTIGGTDQILLNQSGMENVLLQLTVFEWLLHLNRINMSQLELVVGMSLILSHTYCLTLLLYKRFILNSNKDGMHGMCKFRIVNKLFL